MQTEEMLQLLHASNCSIFGAWLLRYYLVVIYNLLSTAGNDDEKLVETEEM